MCSRQTSFFIRKGEESDLGVNVAYVGVLVEIACRPDKNPLEIESFAVHHPDGSVRNLCSGDECVLLVSTVRMKK